MASSGGTIYVIGTPGSALVKIGSTRVPLNTRLKQLQANSPHQLSVDASVSVETDVYALEKQIHHFLAHERQHGEWFAVALDQSQLESLLVRAVQFVEEQKHARTHIERHKIPRKTKDIRQRLATSVAALQAVFTGWHLRIHRLEVELEELQDIKDGLLRAIPPIASVAARLGSHPSWPATDEELQQAHHFYAVIAKALIEWERLCNTDCDTEEPLHDPIPQSPA